MFAPGVLWGNPAFADTPLFGVSVNLMAVSGCSTVGFFVWPSILEEKIEGIQSDRLGRRFRNVFVSDPPLHVDDLNLGTPYVMRR